MKSRILSVAQGKCPRCRTGNLFVHPNPYNLKKAGEMHKNCPSCGLKFTPEPGFYFGAAYVAYGLTVIITGIIFFSLFPFLGWDNIAIYMTVICITLLLLTPILFRVSRSVWIDMFRKYDPKAIANFQERQQAKASEK